MWYTLVILTFVLIHVLVWWKIFSKAGFPGGLAILMLVPLLNVILFMILAFCEWPVLIELARLRDLSQDEHRRFPQAYRLSETADDSIADWLAKEPSAEEMFNMAAMLDKRGDWADALTIYDYVAEKFKDQQEGRYALNCAEQIRDKMKMSRDA